MTKRLGLAALLSVTLAQAASLTVTISGTASGTVGNSNFSNQQITFTTTSDTNSLVHGTACCTLDYTTPSGTPTSLSISGVGSGSLTGDQAIFVNQREQTLGIWHYNSPDWFTIGHPSFGTYDLHTSIGPLTGTTFVFPSVAPMATSLGNLKLNSVGNITVTVVVGGVTNNGPPVISSAGTAFGNPGIAQNTWIAIRGTNLVPATTPSTGDFWSNAVEFLSGRMPTSLNGISVKVNGKPAYVYFYCSSATAAICPTDQINALTPLDNTVGPVQVTVTNGSQTSAPITVNMQSISPAFLQFPKNYVVATHTNTKLLGPTSLYPGLSTPASPNEEVVLYAIGFGLPVTTLTEGSSSQSGKLPSTPLCSINGAPAVVNFAGVITPGLYQLNIVIPNGAANGDNPISCTYAGATTPAGNLISVSR